MYVSSSDAQATAMVVAVSRPPLPCAMFWVGGVSDVKAKRRARGSQPKFILAASPSLV